MTTYWFRILLAAITFSSVIRSSDLLNPRYGKDNRGEKERAPNYEGAQLLKIRRCPDMITVAYKNDFNLWGGNQTHVDIMVLNKNLDSLKSDLSKYSIPYDVVINNVEDLIKSHLHAIKLKNASSESQDHGMTWSSYHRLGIIHGYLDHLASKYPNIASVDVMGHSSEGKPLKYCKVAAEGNSQNPKAFFIEGGIHAREWISPSVVTYILKVLVEERSKLPNPLRKLVYYVLPVMNPDGYEYSFKTDRLWRKNRSGSGSCLGIDLNRNFNYSWAGKGSSIDPCSEIYRGNAAFSEAESKAVSNFILNRKEEIVGYLSFHSYGQLILIPYGFDYNQFPPDYEEMKRVALMAGKNMYAANGARYTAGNTANSLYPASGGADDWAKGAAGVKYSYTVELRDTGEYAFMLPPHEIIPTATDALEAFKTIASAASEL